MTAPSKTAPMTQFDFRSHQVLSDIHSIRHHLDPLALFAIAQGHPDRAAALAEYLSTGKCVQRPPLSEDLMVDIWIAAASPEKHKDAFLLATSILLETSLTCENFAQDLGWLWEAHSAHYRNCMPPIRASLMNGFEQLYKYRRLEIETRPTAADLLTRRKSEAEQLLRPIAKGMTAAEIEHVSRADYQMDVARHYQALSDLLKSETLIYPKEEGYWFPAEVVELVSHVPGNTGHIPCMAIVLLNALNDRDKQANAEFRFESQWRDIKKLPKAPQSAFYAAFRHFYESDEHWSPGFPLYHRFEGDRDVSIPLVFTQDADV